MKALSLKGLIANSEAHLLTIDEKLKTQKEVNLLSN